MKMGPRWQAACAPFTLAIKTEKITTQSILKAAAVACSGLETLAVQRSVQQPSVSLRQISEIPRFLFTPLSRGTTHYAYF